MVKLVALVERRDDLSQAHFARYWTERHAPLAAAIPGMRGYRINVATDPGELPGAPYAGSAEIWFDDVESMRAGLASPEGEAAGEDTRHFAASVTFLLTEEHVILPPEAPAVRPSEERT